MAAPPPKRLLTSDDVPDAPPWLDKVLGPLNAFIKGTTSALDKGITFEEQFSGEVRVITVTPPDEWMPVALANGFAQFSGAPQFGTPAVRKTISGNVEVRGLVTRSAGVPAAGTVIFPFPKGFEPPSTGDRRIIVDGGNSPAYLEVIPASGSSAGGVVFNAGPTGILHIGSVSWVAADPALPRWATPLDVRLGTKDKPFPGRPGHVLVLACSQTQKPTAPAVPVYLDWTATVLEKNTPALRIHRIMGLTPGVQYALTLAILAE